VAAEAAPVPAAELPAEDDRAPATSPLRLLIVEDHEPTLHTLSRLLARGGHHITRAASAAAALEAARAASFDVLISDLGLPDGTGYELFPRLRALHPALRAIVLSGYGTEEDLRKSREAGFFTHLTKPIDFAEVKRALHSLASAAS
jgi:CheY-like chemotaxis protein